MHDAILAVPAQSTDLTGAMDVQKPQAPPPPSPFPRDMLWRLGGGRRSLSASAVSHASSMAVDNAVQPRHGGGSQCGKCKKINKAGAVGGEAAAAAATAATAQSVIQAKVWRDTFANSAGPGTGTMASGAPSSRQSIAPHKDLDGRSRPPERLHQLQNGSSVLALAVNDEFIFAGTHDGEILVWSLGTFQLVHRILAHKRSVLCLFLADKPCAKRDSPNSSTTDFQPLLFSSAGDAIISAWCPKTLTRLYEIYSTHNVGDIFSVAYSVQHDMLFIGAQNTTIQWVSLKDPGRKALHESDLHPDRRHHRFFDSKAVGGTSTPRRNEERWNLIPKARTVLEVDRGAILPFAHFGYVYCMLMARAPTVLVDQDEEVLISGGGDGTIKLWRVARPEEENEQEDESTPGILEELMVLGEDNAESVLSLAIDGSFLYSGKLAGIVELWDLDTKQKLRVIKADTTDVMTLQMGWGFLLSGAADGCATKFSTVHHDGNQSESPTTDTVSQRYQCLGRWPAHRGKILSSAVTTYRGEKLYITGANDDDVCVWRIRDKCAGDVVKKDESDDIMFKSLSELVSFKTISSRHEFAEDCRRGATFLGSLFKRLGGEVEMLSASKGRHNPVVYAKFSGKSEPAEKRKRILFYGHYDVVPADQKKGKWHNDPFELKGMNGYLYGRGVSDNKGPIMAALYAVTDLMQAKQLESDVIFLIEGEEESGSRGFQETVQENKELIGKVDYILLANSYWLDDETPCLTYGLRGVLHATVCVDSPRPDLHSGVDGSYMMAEPLSDLTLVLSKLKGPKNRILIPGFYDGILPLRPEEEARYDEIAAKLVERNPEENGPAPALKASLMARWREPNMTIHRYKVSGPDGSLVSSHASANISFRLVPGQEVDEVIASLTAFLREQVAALETNNSLSVTIDNRAEPWLGDPENYIFRTLEEAIVQVWGLDGGGEAVKNDDGIGGGGGEAGSTTAAAVAAAPTFKSRRPLYIREGGSIPAIRFLEKVFGAPAAHLPCGQASDAAHLDNERLRVTNLLKSREIFGVVFRKL
ncbi:uncharacterized protein E0L32_005255 [Thyridium curvatum]|uniref:Uncharacterized protein n=1 Tax=Thyridium curvatum TaxID=1093900 RepID=A0A507B3Z4_9PEZI|nr:uncharacterized protein E0L32_005255 [Thyridium curvatum]TPX14563.1 hypothetical protein E0L32_005255 [Thyridium curvatum]